MHNKNSRSEGGLKLFKTALIATFPVLSGYLVIGFGFGLLMKAAGLGILPSVIMSLAIYAGSMQYVAVGLFTGGASFVTAALTTLMVNARHLFYGISMLDGYRGTGRIKPYLIFSLTDETYALVSTDNPKVAPEERNTYYLLVSLLNHLYWIVGTALGSLAGTLISFNTEGVEFALTALFLTVLIEQWLTNKQHAPALVGVLAAVISLLIFGKDSFLIPTMLIIALALVFLPERKAVEKNG